MPNISKVLIVKNLVIPATPEMGAAPKLDKHKAESISPGDTVTVQGESLTSSPSKVIFKIYSPAS